ncbi:hypothetical protein [Streptomyces sp. PTD5-9]|uniref:hypothetical protein n=1 Tax=Streptomyces sp. PTD5-9 TaxID=3120150 RepID=UPI00300868B8
MQASSPAKLLEHPTKRFRIFRSENTVYSIEMAYARMRELQDLANRSRAHQPAAARRLDRARTGRAPKKR